MLNDFLDNFTGDGCFIQTSSKRLQLIDNELIFDVFKIEKSEIDKSLGYKKRYDNHSELINIQGCIGYVPVICKDIKQVKKSVYAEFIDYSGSFELLMKGKRLIDNKWIDINYEFEKGKAYILKCQSDPTWPDELRVLAFKELNKPV